MTFIKSRSQELDIPEGNPFKMINLIDHSSLIFLQMLCLFMDRQDACLLWAGNGALVKPHL